MRDSHRLREIERELRVLSTDVRHIGDRITVESVETAFAKQDCYALSAVILGAADDAKRLRVPRRVKETA